MRFGDASAPSTVAQFSDAGIYVLELSADDTELFSSDTITVTVSSASTTQVFSSSLNKRNPYRSFSVTQGAGLSKAFLSFGAGRGKKNANPVLKLDVLDERGLLVASAEGTSPVTLSKEMPAGRYSYRVSGVSTSFELELTHPAP